MESITRSEFEQFRFCKKFFDENGGQPDKRPVWTEESDGQGGKVQRVFISATWFPTWERWQPEAERALNAAVVQFDAFHGVFEKSGTSYPIVGEPHFLLEKSNVWGNEFTIWINGLCPDKEQFELTIAEARKKIENRGKSVPGQRVMASAEPLPLLPFPSAWCQTDLQTIGGSWVR